MDSYKYSCPYCGQHIEYTDDYCGQQMPCPACQHRITFPAIPPGSLRAPNRPKLRLKAPIAQAKETSKFMRLIAALRGYEHWNVVGQCLVPFIILAGALVAATHLHFSPQEKEASAPAPVDPRTWQRMTELDKIEPVVRQSLQRYNTAFLTHVLAEKNRTDMQSKAAGHLNPITQRDLDRRCEVANREFDAARQVFSDAYTKYIELGGKVDYREQMAR